ncbi:hypothetical protein [Streptomyces sp. enrichment culture]|uniref:hypothetical protein n=1 Tax=Streptomyces sp. enrichment culture TaxID=1795815 RepID=UPI003F565DB3
MTTAIMTRAAARTTAAAADPEYACDRCGAFHSGPCPATAHHRLGDLLAQMVRQADARIPAGRRARRTLQEMMPGYERQPVLTLYRPVMADNACPLCGSWSCNPSNCPPASAAPTPAALGSSQQCANCGGWFGVTATLPTRATAWVCDACSALSA